MIQGAVGDLRERVMSLPLALETMSYLMTAMIHYHESLMHTFLRA
jgi:hypothetical protein